MTDEIGLEDFTRIEIRAGTIVAAKLNEKARKTAYSMDIDFGKEIGLKTTSAQVTEEHALHEIVGTQVIAVMNFPPKNVAGVISEVLVLAAVENDGRTVLLSPTKEVENGSRVL